jgi:hypothetical protein
MAQKFHASARAKIDLAEYSRNKTHYLEVALEDAAGTIRLLLTISGSKAGTALSGDVTEPSVVTERQRQDIVRKYVSLFPRLTIF